MDRFNKFLLRQILMLSASSLHSFNGGIIHAFPSVLNPAILSPNATDIKASPDDASWIASSLGLSGIVGFIVLSPIFQIFGRKPVNVILNALIFIGWVFLYFANSVSFLFIGRLIQGLAFGGLFIMAITLGEYSHKKRRGYFMAIKKMSSAIGAFSCHSLGLVLTWRQIIIVGAVTITLSTIFLLQCPESPAFLAMRGRVRECKESFFWLFGTSTESKKELEDIILAQKIVTEQMLFVKKRSVLYQSTKQILQKDFLRPLCIVVLATIALDASGRYFLLAYITQIIVEVTGNPSLSVYCACVADVLLIVGLSLSCVIVKLYNRRTIIFFLGFLLITLLFLVSLTSTLGSKFSILEMKWITASTILLISFVSHAGFITVIYIFIGEVFPLQLKGLGSLISGIIFSTFYFLTIKLTPLMLDKTGIVGTFAVYGLCELVCLFILYFILPETKDKTLQEIEDEMRGNNNNQSSKCHKADVELVLLGSN